MVGELIEPDHICSEIMYDSPKGPVHSDLCAEGDKAKFMKCPEWRKFLHDNLDEWLNNSNGTGYFYIGDAEKWQIRWVAD